MSNVWDQTIFVNQELARKLVSEQFDINITDIALLGEGYDNYAYLINKEFVFRFPRRELGVMCMDNEIALLPHIVKHVSFPFSYPKFIGIATEIYPYAFAGYPILKGKPLCEVTTPLIDEITFASTLGHWLKELHTIEVEKSHYALIEGGQSWRLNINNRIEVLTKSINKYSAFYEQSGFNKTELLAIVDNFSSLEFKSHKDSYLHGDLYSRHILVDSAGIPSGLIDWGDTHIGHPGIDLSCGIMIFTEKALDVFASSYGGIDPEVMQVANFRALCHSMMSLPYTYEQNIEDFKIWVIAALRRGVAKFKESIEI